MEGKAKAFLSRRADFDVLSDQGIAIKFSIKNSDTSIFKLLVDHHQRQLPKNLTPEEYSAKMQELEEVISEAADEAGSNLSEEMQELVAPYLRSEISDSEERYLEDYSNSSSSELTEVTLQVHNRGFTKEEDSEVIGNNLLYGRLSELSDTSLTDPWYYDSL